MIPRIKYSAGLPTDSDTTVLFDSTEYGVPRWLHSSVVRRFAYSIQHDQAGTVKGYWSTDGGTTWVEFYSGEWGGTGSAEVHSDDVLIEPYADVKFSWVNGGTTQTSFTPNLVLSQSRQPSYAGTLTPQAIFGDDLELVLESDKGVLLNSGAVEQWQDQSGKGRHFSQATPGMRPTFNASDANWGGRPSLTFDGTDDKLTSDDAASVWKFLTDGSGGGAIVVYRAASVTSSDAFEILFGATNGATVTQFGIFSRTTGQAHLGLSNGTANIIGNSVTAAEDANHWYGAWYEEGRAGNEYEQVVDGTSLNTANSGAAPDSGDPDATVSIGDNTANSNNSFAGEILAVYAISAYPTDAQKALFQEYLNAKFVDDPITIFGADLELWLDADSKYVVLDQGVKQWKDRSGKGRHFSQATPGSRPAYNALDANWGKPSLGFDGTDDHLISDDAASVWKFLHDGTGGGGFFVRRTSSSTTGFGEVLATRAVGGTDIGAALFNPRANTKHNFYVYSAGDVVAGFTAPNGSAPVNTNTYAIAAYEEGRAGNEWTLIHPGATVTGNSVKAPSSSDPTATAHIGVNTSAGASWLDGELVELCLFSVYPSATQQGRIGQYISWRLPIG